MMESLLNRPLFYFYEMSGKKLNKMEGQWKGVCSIFFISLSMF